MLRGIKPYFIRNQHIKYRLPSFKSDIFLIEWLPYARTEIHCHSDKHCNYIVLNGPLFEKRYLKKNKLDSKPEILVYNQFDRGFINDSIGKHQMINFSRYKKWSIHRYT